MYNIQIITTSILVFWICIVVTLEHYFPYTKGLKLFRKGWWIDLVWYTFIQSFFLTIVINDYIITPIKTHLGLAEAGILSHLPMWSLVLIFLFTHDFYIYWFHRFQHHNKLFWRTHEAHHSNTEVDWLAGSRSHILEIIINQTVEFAPIVLLVDTHTAAILVPIKALMDAVWGIWIHSNIDVHTGRLQYIINGPEMHQWHHSNHQEVFYSNYGTKFAFWDWIFGTAFLPGLNPFKYQFLKPQTFGLPYDYPRDYFMQHWFSFQRFDVKKVESISWLKPYIEWKENFLKLFKKSTPKEHSTSDPHPTE